MTVHKRNAKMPQPYPQCATCKEITRTYKVMMGSNKIPPHFAQIVIDAMIHHQKEKHTI